MSSLEKEKSVSEVRSAKVPVTEGGFAGQELRVKKGAATGVKVEVGAGDFSTNRKPEGFFTKFGGDVLTEYVAGPMMSEKQADPKWVKSQMRNALALAGEGAFVGLGVDVRALDENLANMFGGKAPEVRKLKVENPAVTMEQRESGKAKEGLAYSDIFASADKNLAKHGVLEWGLTGPLKKDFQQKNMVDVFKTAEKSGFELVEVRTKTAKSHTFSQKDEGMHNLGLTQYVFARKDEAKAVREYTQERITAKGGKDGYVEYGGKTRKLF